MERSFEEDSDSFFHRFLHFATDEKPAGFSRNDDTAKNPDINTGTKT